MKRWIALLMIAAGMAQAQTGLWKHVVIRDGQDPNTLWGPQWVGTAASQLNMANYGATNVSDITLGGENRRTFYRDHKFNTSGTTHDYALNTPTGFTNNGAFNSLVITNSAATNCTMLLIQGYIIGGAGSYIQIQSGAYPDNKISTSFTGPQTAGAEADFTYVIVSDSATNLRYKCTSGVTAGGFSIIGGWK